jgi:hypothetical protein
MAPIIQLNAIQAEHGHVEAIDNVIAFVNTLLPSLGFTAVWWAAPA